MSNIAVIGGGWYGCHIARVLRLAGHNVTLFESNADIFTGISGKFGIRLHKGPHYPRSAETRKSCREGYDEFINTYPELVVEHAYSIYGLGIRDADNQPPKIDLKTFREVGKENKNSREIDPVRWGYRHLQGAIDIEESSIVVGNPLRKKFKKYLQDVGVNVVCNFRVHKLERKGNKTLVFGDSGPAIFDYAVNTTSYQALLPSPGSSLPFGLDVVYQPCLALVYEDRLSKSMSLPPFSFIVMDGWFPCMMPWMGGSEGAYRKYIVTHGKYTIMGSFRTVEEANACLAKIDAEFVTKQVQPRCEAEMERFWPLFGARIPASKERRFEYIGWQNAVLAKLKTNREFRSAVTFAEDGIIHIIPGKVSNVFDAGREVELLVNNSQKVLRQGKYQYVEGGVLHKATNEVSEAIVNPHRNTGNLQTYAQIIGGGSHIGLVAGDEKSVPSKPLQSSSPRVQQLSEWITRKNVDQVLARKDLGSAPFFPLPLSASLQPAPTAAGPLAATPPSPPPPPPPRIKSSL